MGGAFVGVVGGLRVLGAIEPSQETLFGGGARGGGVGGVGCLTT